MQDVTKLVAPAFGVAQLDLRLMHKNKLLPPRVALAQQRTEPLSGAKPRRLVALTVLPKRLRVSVAVEGLYGRKEVLVLESLDPLGVRTR